MSRRTLLASLMLLCLAAVAPAKDTAKITVRVRDNNNQPVNRAAVIVKRMRGKHVKTSYELSTSQEGTAPLPPLPQGTYLIQVIAKGYQTFGEKYTLSEPEKTIDIQLQPPQAQFSVDKPAGK